MKSLAAACLLLTASAQASELVEYRITLEVAQKAISVQEIGYGATQTNMANATKIVTLKKESAVTVFNQTSMPAYGRFFDKNMSMRKDEIRWETSADSVNKCALDNLSWPYKYLVLGMTHREDADWVLLEGEFRSERIYEDCESSPRNNTQLNHTYTQETEKVNFGIKMEKNQIYTHTFKSSRIPTKLIIERIN